VLTVDQAQARVLAALVPTGDESVMLGEAAGRVLAADVVATRTLPPWDASAMDGYAVRAADCVAPGAELPVVATIGAGHTAPRALGHGEAMRIMTGAPLPSGADAVVMREHAEELPGGRVRLARTARPEDHVRRAGEDVCPEQTALAAGTVLRPGELGLLAALGCATLRVHRRPTVAIVSTGDELVDVEQAPGPGQIVSSNAFALAAQVRDAGGVPILHPITRDDPAALRERFADALAADVLVSSGGVSVGEFDYVKEALGAVGLELDFWRVAMQPGKPLAFGMAGRRPGFGLPGNPASAFVSFELFVGPALRALGGRREGIFRPRATVEVEGSFERREGGRRLFLRARVLRQENHLRAHIAGLQGSHHLRSLCGVNALVEVAEDVTRLAAGDAASALLLEAV
jgi:molybdopterin molybdotransferase